MISRSYIHEYAAHDQVMCESYCLLLESKDVVDSLIRLEQKISEKEYFGESVENEIFVLESEKKNIFTRIGELVIEIFNSMVDFLKDTGKAITDAITGARKKSNSEKFKKAMRDDPQLAQDFLKGVMSGNIKAHDVKNLNELLDEATTITNDLMKGKIDKKTFGKKIDESLDKFANLAKNLTTIIGIGTAITGLVKGVDYVTRERNRNDEKHEWSRNNEDRAQARENREIDQHNWKIEDRNNGPRGPQHIVVHNADTYEESVQDELFTESVLEGAFQKVMSFFTSTVGFCKDAIGKLNDLKDSLLDKVKNGNKDSEEGEKVNAALAGIRKVISAITKEMTIIKNSSSKVEASMA